MNCSQLQCCVLLLCFSCNQRTGVSLSPEEQPGICRDPGRISGQTPWAVCSADKVTLLYWITTEHDLAFKERPLRELLGDSWWSQAYLITDGPRVKIELYHDFYHESCMRCTWFSVKITLLQCCSIFEGQPGS